MERLPRSLEVNQYGKFKAIGAMDGCDLLATGLKDDEESRANSSSAKAPKDDPRFSLKGNTLRLYMHILRSNENSVGVREIQRQLGFSSPTLAKYHLEKLQSMGLLKYDEEKGSYSLIKEVKVDVLQPFVTLGSIIIPRLFTYAVMISILFAYMAIVVIPSGNLIELEFFATVVGVVSLVSLWYETLRSWRNSPR